MGRQIGRGQRRGSEPGRNAEERQRVECVDLERQAARQARRGDGERQPERAADDRQLETTGNERPDDVRRVSAERHASADLAPPLRDAVAHHAVESTTASGGASTPNADRRKAESRYGSRISVR